MPPTCSPAIVARVGAHVGDLIGWACTINEINLIGVMGYALGSSPPGVKDDFVRHLAVNDAMVRAHRQGVDALRSGPGSFPVGLTLSMDEMVADPGGEDILEAAQESPRGPVHAGLAKATTSSGFSATRVSISVRRARLPMSPACRSHRWATSTGHRESSIAPGGPRPSTGVPVLLTESGIATDNDTERITYLAEVLRGVRRALDDGVDIRGYFVWSLLDNFEWSLGFRTQVRTAQRRPADVRPPAQTQRSVVRRGGPSKRLGGAAGLSGVRHWSDRSLARMPPFGEFSVDQLVDHLARLQWTVA